MGYNGIIEFFQMRSSRVKSGSPWFWYMKSMENMMDLDRKPQRITMADKNESINN